MTASGRKQTLGQIAIGKKRVLVATPKSLMVCYVKREQSRLAGDESMCRKCKWQSQSCEWQPIGKQCGVDSPAAQSLPSSPTLVWFYAATNRHDGVRLTESLLATLQTTMQIED